MKSILIRRNGFSLASPIISIGIKDKTRLVGKDNIEQESKDEHDGDGSVLDPSGRTCSLVVTCKRYEN